MPDERFFIDPIVSATDRGGNRERLLEQTLGFNSRGGVTPTQFIQRIYDSSVGWCWYDLTAVTATPAVSDTTPNHTNNLVASSHEVFG
jgi:hypothetical protein